MRRKKIAVAMSGGVDSSVTAAILQKRGFDVIGMTMRLFRPRKGWDEEGEKTVTDARLAAEALGISHTVVDLCTEFERRVMADFCLQYASGRTPNPCVRCNRFLKFGRFLESARKLGADIVATGHYAQIRRDSESGLWRLSQGRDRGKDQSYFLYTLTQDRLSRILMPLGHLTKAEVIKRAERLGLPSARRPESQEICFIRPGDDHTSFLRERIPEAFRPGPILDTGGRVIGKHGGIALFTIGQRRGMGIAAAEPLYVAALDPEKNTVTAAPREGLYSGGLLASNVNYISGEKPSGPFRAKVKIRYRHPGVEAVVTPAGSSRVRVVFGKPQRAVTPGQSVVFYRRAMVIGGGTIESVE